MFKLKIVLFTFIALTLCVSTEAQSVFHQSYDFNKKGDGGRGIIEARNNNILTFGDYVSNGIFTRFLLVDSSGTIGFDKDYSIFDGILNGGGLWKSGYYGFGDHFNAVEGAGDGHFMFIDNNGDSVKTLLLNLAFNERIEDAILLSDSTFVILGTYTDTAITDAKPYIAQIDTLGNVLWFKTHNDTSIQEQVKNIAPTQDGGYVIGGYEEQAPSSFQDLFLLKVDSVGNFEWKKNYGGQFTEVGGYVIPCSDGGFAIVGTIVNIISFGVSDANRGIRKTDSLGNILWTADFGTTQFHEGFEVIREMPDKGFICAGTSSRLYNSNRVDYVNLSRLDSLGNQLWSRDYNLHGMDINQYVRDLKITADGGFVMTGFILNAPPGNRNDIFILKTDANGIITSLGNNGFQEVEIATRAYPNPTTGEVTIPPVPEIESIQVLNLNGQLVQTVSPSLLGETRFEINGKAGVYLLNILLDNGKVSTAKIVKN